jgi:hypothetical protein
MIPLPPSVYLVTAMGVAAILAGTHWKLYTDGRKAGAAQVQQRWDQQLSQLSAERLEAEMKARQREQALQRLANQQRTKHREEVDRILRDHAALVDSLQNRPDRPAPAASGAGTVPQVASLGAVGCTGAQLARPDAEFLAGYAADAARLQTALKRCETAYNNAVKAQQ